MRIFAQPQKLIAPSLMVVATFMISSASYGQNDMISPMRDRGDCQAVHAVQETRVVVDCPADQSFGFLFYARDG